MNTIWLAVSMNLITTFPSVQAMCEYAVPLRAVTYKQEPYDRKDCCETNHNAPWAKESCEENPNSFDLKLCPQTPKFTRVDCVQTSPAYTVKDHDVETGK